MSTPMPDSEVERFAIKETVEYQHMARSIHLLGEAVESLDHTISPQMAAGIVATENAWRDMEAEFGLLDGRTVAQISGSKQTTGGFANDRRKARKILGISRRNAYRYPGFQFTESGKIYESVLAVLRVAPELGVSDEDVAQWFLLESPSLDGNRPVDVIDDVAQVLAVFQSRFGTQW
ncbi:MAG TPA: hypothetical protein K8V32_04155 [Enteractinococcus helveticum]|uniref:Antitoxin Xre/MbcA/ParS-like toxin-binding domain-containing protein n=1 Tax=Enteractinococcus helveticum TaxID=1837282 RepID=A0A921FN39_9MICC|nr:hypothetical protein [Enteractinococcus helveticum]HJF13982.1 hypothetical protein [Enteractinococcus helveticum]